MATLDYIIMGVSLVAVLVIGWLSGRKSNNSDEFLMAGRGLNKVQVGFSMAATDFGGSGMVGAIGYCYLVGMGGIWWNLAAAPAFLFVGLFLAKKLNKLDGATVPDYLGNRYSPGVKYLSSSLHVVMNTVLLSTQFTISSAMLYTITGMDPNVTLIISVLLVLLLTSGGLRAVINTDDALFVIIMISIAFAVPLALKAGGGLAAVERAVPAGFMSIGSIGFWQPLSWIVMCFLSYATNQNYVQRMVSAKNEGTARFAALFTSGFYLVISVALGLIGISASVLVPGLEDTNTVFPELLKVCFPKGMIGLGVAGVFAATISTGTSLLHSLTVLTVNDLIKPAMGSRFTDKRELACSRIVVVAVAVFSTLISLYFTNIINVIYTATLFYSIAVFAPMILGMYSRKITAKGALVSMIGTLIAALGWQYLVVKHLPSAAAVPANVVGLAVSFLLILAVSAADRKGQAGARQAG
jgi:SSS family solute:Na+ symporter